MEANNVRVMEPLKQLEFVIDHLLIALDILLEDDLHGNLPCGSVRLSNNTIGASTLDEDG